MKHVYGLIYVLCISLLIAGCTKTPSVDYLPPEIELSGKFKFKKLENPYSVTNMQKAYAALNQDKGLRSSSIENTKLKATHYYILFKPTTDLEIGKLKSDSTIDFYSYPLDVQLPEDFNGTEYSDYQKKIGAPEYYYA